jgi:predicted house-cleaning noncanonical NTP pyrophosphatase (MazG superfamily)
MPGGPTSERKLVRDNIPAIIRAGGQLPITGTATPEEFRARLADKLREEAAEAAGANRGDQPAELADVLEVIYAMAAGLGLTPADMEKIRAAKAAERGGFTNQVIWFGNEQGEG